MRKRTPGEKFQDIETLYSIIVSAREDFPDLEMTERIALTALCFFTWPGKAPPYQRDIVEFRRRYIGVARSGRMQEDFRSRISEAVLNVESIDELSFNELSDIFRIDDEPDWSEGTHKQFLPGAGRAL